MQRGPCFRGQPLQPGEERPALPLGHEAGHAFGLDARGQGLVGGAALGAGGGRGQPGRGALQQQGADGRGVARGDVEGQAAAHGVAQPERRQGVAAGQQGQQIGGDALHGVAGGVGRGVAGPVAGQIDGQHAAAPGQGRQGRPPGGGAAGEAMEQQQRLARALFPDRVAQAVDRLVAHAAARSWASSRSATRRRCTLPLAVWGSSSCSEMRRGHL